MATIACARTRGRQFRRQYAFGRYILDFYSPQHRLAIEVDGSTHETPEGQEADAMRTEYLRGRGVRVLRFTNVEALTARDLVLEAVFRAMSTPHPDPLPARGEGVPVDVSVPIGRAAATTL